MSDFPNQKDLARIARDEILSKNGRLTLRAVERDGADANLLLAGASAMGDEVIGQVVDVAASQYLDSAEREKLDRYVFDRYGMVRKEASPSLGSVEFYTTAPAAATFSIPIGTTLQTGDGIQFLTVQAASFPLGSTGPIIVPVRSTRAGADQQAGAEEITSIVSQVPSSPSDLRVLNTLATAGADNQEDDPSLRDRARRFWSSARRGTLGAIEAGALAVQGVRRSKAFEVLDVSGRPARLVQLVVSDAFTDALVDQGVNPPAYQVQSQQLAMAVFTGLADVRAGGIFVHVIVAQIVLQAVQLNLRFIAGVDVDLVALVARSVIVAETNSLPPGETWSREAMTEALRAIPGLDVQGDEISSPAGDLIPAPLQAIRTSLNLVQVAPVQTDQPVALTATSNPDSFIIR